MPVSLPPSSSSPPALPPSALARRRSQSRSTSSSGGTGSYRSSLGGKSIGPKYQALSSGVLRRDPSTGPPGSSSFGDNSSRVSFGSEVGSDGGLRFGSFSATREELRDGKSSLSLVISRLAVTTRRGSARLASFSLANPTPLPSPGLDEGSSSSPSSASPIDTPRASNSAQLFPSPSNLSLARPPAPYGSLGTQAPALHAAHPASSSTSPSSASPAAASPTYASVASARLGADKGGSPSSGETDKDPTPTQSKMGSLQTPVSSGLSAVVEGSSGEQTPTPAGLLEHREAHIEAVRQKIRALGDEIGGLDSDEEEEALVQAQIEAEEEEAAREEERQKSRREEERADEANERTSLLGGRKLVSTTSFVDLPAVGAATRRFGGWVDQAKKKAKGVSVTREDLVDGGKVAVQSIPAVILGVLMNILDGVSYGMIMFPTNLPVFADFGGIGVSMFFASCVVSQLVYSGGGSIFKGGNGSMMIEVVPFYHVIVGIITGSISDDKSVVATTMVAFALSSILTGIAFGLLGWLKLGSLSEFFPRHILVGCIGGVGAFLFVTGLQVSARLEEEAGFSMDLVKHYFDWSILPLWTVPLLLAVVLRLITARFHHPLIFPGYFLAIPFVFYGIAFAAGFNLDQLREGGWVFEVNGVDSEWYEYWTLFDFKKTDYSALLDTIPTQLALVFFGLLHVPINVPALGISVGEDNVNTDRELIAHGISNVAAGLLGTVPNYLCYVNSVLFYKVGGTTRISGFLLAAASFGILVAGPGIISLLPVCIVGALIFILAIDLIKEAIWDTHGRVARFEYVTIWAIVIVMTGWDFVAGIGAGIILACVSFVVSSSQRRAIRSILTGAVARSTVRRHPKQSAFLKEVGRQTRVIKLQGFLFFGTISACEATIRKILEAASWSKNPIRFLVLDFSMASGVDFSAAEAFVRIQRLLEDKGVVLVLCGCPATSNVGIALRSVDLWADGAEAKVEVFENLNDALEHCENAFLRSLYSKDYQPPRLLGPAAPAISSQIDVPKSELESEFAFEQSPRASHLRNAAKETMARPEAPAFKTNFQQPLPLLMQSFKPFAPDLNEDYCFRLVPYFKRVHIERGTTLWTDGAETDSFYLIESGMLRATYVFTDRAHSIVESMVAGTVAGEMSFLSRSKRNATVVAERDSVLWKMSVESHEELGKREGWSFARKFEQCLLSIAIEEQDVLMGHLISSL